MHLFEVVYGRPPLLLARYIPGKTAGEVGAHDLINCDETLKQLKFHL